MLEPHPDYIRKIVIQQDKENRELFGVDIAQIPDDVSLEEYLSDARISIYLGKYLCEAFPFDEINLTAADIINALQRAMYYFKLSLKEENEIEPG